jgi:hypothetical protein
MGTCHSQGFNMNILAELCLKGNVYQRHPSNGNYNVVHKSIEMCELILMQIGLVIVMIINPCYLFHIGKWNNELELKKKTSIAMLSLKVKYMMVPQVVRHAIWISSYFANNIDHP